MTLVELVRQWKDCRDDKFFLREYNKIEVDKIDYNNLEFNNSENSWDNILDNVDISEAELNYLINLLM